MVLNDFSFQGQGIRSPWCLIWLHVVAGLQQVLIMQTSESLRLVNISKSLSFGLQTDFRISLEETRFHATSGFYFLILGRWNMGNHPGG